jgi:hypothetical protein
MNRSALSALAAVAVVLAGPSAAIADEVPKGAIPTGPSSSAVFPYEQGVVDLLITGPAAKALYDRLPGKGAAQACGATGLHKGDGRIGCTRNDADYACHIWLDVPAQSLTDAETDDC